MNRLLFLGLSMSLSLSLAACDSDPAEDAGVDAGPMDGGGDAGPLDAGPIDAGPDDGGAGDGGPDGGASDGGMDDGGLIGGRPRSPLYGMIVFNEVLTDGTTEGDPNGDGDADPVEDQFVEIVSLASSAIDLGGFTLVEEDLPDLPRHTFAAGFSLAANAAVVVFGGGDAPDASGSTTFFAANAADPGLPFGLHLSTPADSLWLLDLEGAVVARFCYGGDDDCALEPAADESLTRSPERTGDFVPHRDAAGSSGEAFSVGTRADGTAF